MPNIKTHPHIFAPHIPKNKMRDEFTSMSETFAERGKQYKGSYKTFGDVWHILLGDFSLEASSPQLCARIGLLMHIVGKLVRYCEKFPEEEPNPDNLHDLAVYATMLKVMDDEISIYRHGNDEPDQLSGDPDEVPAARDGVLRNNDG